MEKVGDAPLKDILAKIGGWPVVNESWNGSNWSLERSMGFIRGNFDAPELFMMMVATDDKNSSVRIIQV